MKQPNELRQLMTSTAWAVQPEYLQSRLALVDMLGVGGPSAEIAKAALDEEKLIQAARRQQISAASGGAVAVLPMYGLISHRSNWMSYYFGGTTTESFTMQFRQAVADPNITAIVIDVDSPGGSVSGVAELAAEILAARKQKTIVAISNSLNASAAYYLSCAAGELVVSPSSLTGSIGVYNSHVDESGWMEKIGVKVTLISAGKYKTEGNSYGPLEPEAEAAMQAMVNGYYDDFVSFVAKARGKKKAEVIGGFGEGRVLMAGSAVTAGLADRVATFDAVLAKFGVKRTGQEGSYYASAAPLPAAEQQKPAPAAAAKADEEDGSDSDSPGDSGCGCPCEPCCAGNCDGCTDADCGTDACKCTTAKGKKDTKAKAEHAHQLALQRQRVAVALAI